MENYRCPACNGDGNETCHNPDHGFLSAIGSIRGNANESSCPCCGHDSEYKVKKYVDGKYVYLKCWECSGTGVVDQEECERILDEYGIDTDPDDFKVT